MRDTASRMFLLVLVLLGLWVLTYWLYEPSGSGLARVTTDADARAVQPSSLSPRVTMDPPEARPALITPQPAQPTEPPQPPPPRADRLVTKVQVPEFREYIVQKGDTGWMQIAARAEVYADPRKWQAVARANPLVSPDRLKPGVTKLRIPTDTDPNAIQGKLVQVPAPAGDDSASSSSTMPADPAQPPASPTPADTDPPATERTHTVGPKDSLWSIAKKEYGKGSLWRVIYEANKDVIKDPDRPPTGAVLRIPPKP